MIVKSYGYLKVKESARSAPKTCMIWEGILCQGVHFSPEMHCVCRLGLQDFMGCLNILGKPSKSSGSLFSNTHRIHVWNMNTNIYPINDPNVGKYTSTMDPMG